MAESSAYVLTTLARNWWALILRGFIAILFGLIAWFWPGLALYTLIVLFAVTVIAGGLLSIVAAVRSISERERWLPLAAEGLIGIGAGLLALIWPDLAAKTFLYIIAIWAILNGILEIVAAVRLRREISNEWFLGLAGLASIVFGIIAIARPLTGALAVLWLIGIGSIFIGAFLVLLGWRLRALNEVASVSRGRASGAEQAASGEPGRSPGASERARPGAVSASAVSEAVSVVRPGKADEKSLESPAPSDQEATAPGGESDRSTGSRSSRRERALQELIDSLPPEGTGWVRGDGTTRAPSDYPLKGNANSRIYHAPGGQSYDETIAELCFATDQDAVKAGFRARQEPEGYGSKPSSAAAGTAESRPELVDDIGPEALDVSAMEARLEPVGVDVDGTLETLDVVDDTSSTEISEDSAESHSDIEVTEGAAAAWTPVDSGTDSIATHVPAGDRGDDDRSAHHGDATIADMDYDDELVIDEALLREAEQESDVTGTQVDQFDSDASPAGDHGNAGQSDQDGAGIEAPDERVYDSIEQEIEAAFEAALEEGVAPPETTRDVSELTDAEETDGAGHPAEDLQRDSGGTGAADELPAGETLEESLAESESLSPAATLVDASGEGVATAIEPDSPAESSEYDGDSGIPVAEDTSADEMDVIQPSLPSLGAEEPAGGLDEELLHGVSNGETTAGVGVEHSDSHDTSGAAGTEELYSELSASLSPEGERWMRGLGRTETPTGFPVKGNASSRLYHMPGGRSYAVTIPEICFASADDAKAAGFRPRNGDPTELDERQIREVSIPASLGMRTQTGSGDERSAGPAPVDDTNDQPSEGPGWIRNSGSKDCPADFPVKGNASSRIYHVPTGGSYEATIPEFCFASPEAAEAAGFRAARN